MASSLAFDPGGIPSTVGLGSLTNVESNNDNAGTRLILRNIANAMLRILVLVTKRGDEMRLVKRIGVVALATVMAVALLAPTGAEARNGRVAAGIVGGLAAGALFGAAISGGYWGPYPYYRYPAPVYYYPPEPYWGPSPFWGPYGYYGGCYRRAVWHGRHLHYVRVCY